MKNKKNISSVIGTFEGKCCDSNVVNSNGMFLNSELFNNLINSDDYKTAMENRYYIGYLGHPEDPNCMEFQNACIIMTDMEMDKNGEIFGTFDLVDTPVGRVVKAFIDAGVNFGISIRGAGDLDNKGNVDPDTFVFRGFDLVTFPAYSDCVPEFQQIAASSDVEAQKKYKKVCAVIDREAKAIKSSEAIEVIQEQLNENSNEYEVLEEAKQNLAVEDNSGIEFDIAELAKERIDAVMELYINQVRINKELLKSCEDLTLQLCEIKKANSRTQSLVDSQIYQLNDEYSELEAVLNSERRTHKKQVTANKKLKREYDKVVAELDNYKNKSIVAKKEISKLNSVIDDIQKENLQYSQKIKASKSLTSEKDAEIEDLRSQLSETVAKTKKINRDASNREDEIEDLQAQVKACEGLIFEYQQAYADMCANAVGVELSDIYITSNTSVEELRHRIYGSSSVPSTSSRNYVPHIEVNEFEEEDDNEDLIII